MTTIRHFSFSYGDRSPRGFLARIFAIVWVLVGLVITSIFTGVVTTSLTAITLSTDVKLYGAKVGFSQISSTYFPKAWIWIFPRTEGNFDALPKKTVLQRLQPNFGIDDVIVNSKHTFLTRIFPPPRNLALQGALKRKEPLLRLVLNFKLSPNMFLSQFLSSQKPNSI